MKKILFLSGLDFKEKSIQVIRKTPEAYVEEDWDVSYIVARDESPTGNYFYEEPINIKGVKISRFHWPFPKTRAKAPRHLSLMLSKISSLFVVAKLSYKAYQLNKKENFDVIYGYELQGVLAMQLLKSFISKKTKTVSRFQGTFLNEMFTNKQYFRLLFNFDLILAIFLKSDLLIMTDDGTQGDLAVKKIKGNNKYNMLFLPNGVDYYPNFKSNNQIDHNKVQFVTVSRLVEWKRVDRCIKIFYEYWKLNPALNPVLNIIGDGLEKNSLIRLVQSLGITKSVNFLGALKHHEVPKILTNSDVFLSMYQSSNVGNPLLEAIRSNLLIITLNNGDTNKWIKNFENGLIYDESKLDYKKVAQDIDKTLSDDKLITTIKRNLKNTEDLKLQTWKERLLTEVKSVNNLLYQEHP